MIIGAYYLHACLCFHPQPGDGGLSGVQAGGYEDRQHFVSATRQFDFVITFFAAVKIGLPMSGYLKTKTGVLSSFTA